METSTRRLSSLGLSNTAPASGSQRRSILKTESCIDVHDDIDRAMASAVSETPDQFFQRVLRTRTLSPLDLCDAFCFGDARKHRHVALKHVCEVLFELEAPGCDPMSDAMEEFLYRFAFDGGDGEIVVDIQEALRTLDIWRTTAPSSPSRLSQVGSPHSTSASVSPAKAAMLEVKAEKLKKVIDSLQQENVRLSRALSSSTTQSEVTHETRPPSPLRIAVKKATPPDMVPSISSRTTSPHQRLGSPSKHHHPQEQQPSPAKVVSRHERELIALANRLEYAGVRKLEELLRKGDAAATTSTGFVSLKQLRWLLANECRVGDHVSESQLMELCLGMNFNAQGQLDYNEFVRVLLDILVYESRPSRVGNASSAKDHRAGLSEADEVLLQKTREYLRGFGERRDKIRELLNVLCDKYDLEGNQCLALTEMVRLFQSDLAGQHLAKLKLPLTQSETRKLLLGLAESSARHRPQTKTDRDDGPFVFYPAILDAIFRADTSSNPRGNPQALLARVLAPEFWMSLRSALCPHDNNPALERKIHAQLCKILMKLDPKHSFQLAQRHFVRVFDQHWSSRDLDLLAEALSQPLDGRTPRDDGVVLRYDILMRLVFGAPELRDGAALATVLATLRRESAHWRDELTELVHANANHKAKILTYHQVYDVLCVSESPKLNVTAFLYLMAHVHDDAHLGSHRINAQKLWTLLNEETKGLNALRTANEGSSGVLSGGGRSFTLLRRCLRVLCDEHALENALARLCRHERGVVRTDELATMLSGQLRVLQLAQQQQNELHDAVIVAFVDSLAQGDEASPGSELLYAHALLDAIFDWDALTAALRLPDRLVDVKKTLELFDWERDSSIDADDWNKAWRQLTVRSKSDQSQPSSPPLPDWAMRVLVRRFPAGASTKRARRSTQGLGAIDYSRLLVFLLERQQRGAREQLQAAVLMLLQQTCERVTQGKRHVSTFHLESAFEQLDRDGKGYFHVGDLRAFVVDQLSQARGGGMDVPTLQAYTSQGPALESVMALLVGEKPRGAKQQVVSLMRFQELMNHGFFLHGRHQSKPSPSHRRGRQNKPSASSYSGEDGDDTSSAEESTETDDRHHGRRRSFSSGAAPLQSQITLLRDLELCIFDISQPFVDAHGQISPAAMYAHLNGVASPSTKPSRRPRSQSPVRSSLRSPTTSLRASYNSVSSRRSSCTTPRTIAEAYDPLTASRLKQTLRSAHGVETSTHLIGQFFLRLGASTKHFLELALFAKWLTPLSGALQARVKQVVREMLVKSKSGGGHVDLERFVGAVDRKLADAQMTEGAMVGHSSTSREGVVGIRTVRPAVLLTRLHQLNVSLRKPEMAQLVRHFGMEDQPEVDFALFLRRLYELAQQLPMHADRQ